MPNRIEAAKRKLSHKPPGDYCHCASSRLHNTLNVRIVTPDYLQLLRTEN
jgi:hypothetical protein